ncbi:hypothetical protein V9T40_008082 [Parthenolecanium corni]|uniref:Uncharacterized protein n=1 Tax=Parthenolecanium corni TaxID=536013 RepID=A0AAN9Y756_9HEMI
MFKFVVIACFVSFVCAAPLDSKAENGSKKMNLTENRPNDQRAASPYTNYYPGYFSNPQPIVNSPATFYSAPPLHSLVVNNQVKPLTSYSSSYYQGLLRNNDPKTGHLRPQLYLAQPQINSYQSYPTSVYSYPQSVYSYPQSVYSYPSSYHVATPYYGNYGYYKQAEEQREPTMVMHSAPANQVLVEKPVGQQQVNQIPMGADQQIASVVPRDASSNWAPAHVPFTALPQDNFGQLEDIRRRDILIDGKYNLQIQPSYLMDRLHMQSAPTSGRSAEDSSEFGPAASEDDVYVVMNPYDHQHPMVAKAAVDETPMADSQGSMNSFWMQPVFNSPITPANFRDNGNLPYSHENVLRQMQQFYENKYRIEMEKTNQLLSQRAKISGRSAEDELIRSIAEAVKKQANQKISSPTKTEANQQVKAEDKKETTTLTPKVNAA